MNIITEEDTLSRVAGYYSTAEYCKVEVSEKLQKWDLPYEAVNRTIDRLVVEKFIDEERYCRAFVNDKSRFAGWGKMKIIQALYMEKISREVSYRYLSDIDQEEYLAVLRDLMVAKRKGVHAKDEFELNGELIHFAMSRGFEMDGIRRCVQVEEE